MANLTPKLRSCISRIFFVRFGLTVIGVENTGDMTIRTFETPHLKIKVSDW
jgi:hypothetical protein